MGQQFSRRRMLGSGLAIGAGAAGTAAWGAGRAEAAVDGSDVASGGTFTADVAVVGAGFAGLVAARKLAAGGAKVLVLEARDRVGGRIHDLRVSGGRLVEAGGQFTGPTQNRLAALAASLGVQTFTGYNDGESLYHTGGQAIRYTGALPPMDDAALQALGTAIWKLNQLAATVPVDAPWTAPDAEALDGQTFATWILGQTDNATARAVLFLMANGALSAEARDMSLLWFLFYVAASGNESQPGTVERLISTLGGARDSRFVGGPHQIAQRVADALGSRVILNSPVRGIAQSSAGVVVRTDRFSVRASHAVVALPPPLAARLAYTPALPARRDQLTQRFPLSSIGKAVAVYDTPFWREDGLNGQAASDSGTVRSTFDNSPPDASYGALLGFLDGDQMRAVHDKTDAEVKALVLADFTRYFGQEAAAPDDFVLLRWDAEEYSRGGAPGFMPPGVLTRYGATVRAPSGRIHWAGAETGTFWNGHMEGAVRSGERAAAEILNG